MALVERPWGGFRYLLRRPGVTVKVLTINSGQALSYQRHAERNEYWYPLNEGAHCVLNDTTFTMKVGRTFVIPRGQAHRIINPSDAPVEVLEVAVGEFDEDDIVRINDMYDR